MIEKSRLIGGIKMGIKNISQNLKEERIIELTNRIWKANDRETIRKSINSIRYLNGIGDIIKKR